MCIEKALATSRKGFLLSISYESAIKITNILGISMANFTNGNMLENNTFKCDIFQFPTGVYIVSIVSNNKIIARTKISKL
jgi:Secretion system C-terminal sorting domain